jgi:hypothetical protein
MTLAGLALIAAGLVAILLLLVEGVTWASDGRSFLATVIIGEDGRTSTSKTFILLWTLLVGWALVALLIAGQFVTTHACISTATAGEALHRCQKVGDRVGLLQLGWTHFLNAGLSGSYLILLGVPAAAGVAAKGIAQNQAQSSTAVKTPATKDTGTGAFNRIAQIFSADDGTTDIGDFQYLIFNLVTAAYFVSQFLNPDGSGLPTIPDTLLGLTSVSAGLYVGKKAVTRSQAMVTGVFPMPVRDGQTFTILGTGLTVDPAMPTDGVAQVSIDGAMATNVVAEGTNLRATAPANLAPGGTPTTRQLRILSPYGVVTSDFTIQCA